MAILNLYILDLPKYSSDLYSVNQKVWSDEVSVLQILGNCKNIAVLRCSELWTIEPLELVTQYPITSAVEKSFIDNECLLAIHSKNGTFPFLTVPCSSIALRSSVLPELYKGSNSTKEIVYLLEHILAVVVWIHLLTGTSTHLNACTALGHSCCPCTCPGKGKGSSFFSRILLNFCKRIQKVSSEFLGNISDHLWAEEL